MNYMKHQYHEIREFYKQHIKRIFLIMFVLFIASLLLFSILLSVNPGLATRMLIKTSALVDNTVNLAGLLPTIIKNIFTGFYLLMLGAVPFLFISSWFVIINGSMIGILVGSTAISTITIGSIVASVLPHGIILIPAMLLASAYGVYLCRNMIAHVLHKEDATPYKKLLFELGRAFIFVIIPLMIVASILQVILTPIIVSLM